MTLFEMVYNKMFAGKTVYEDLQDIGGDEIYLDINRNKHPEWEGWDMIDDMRIKYDFPTNVINSHILKVHAQLFYKQTYWDSLLLDTVSYEDIASKLFRISIDLGVVSAAMFLQEGLNTLNKEGMMFKFIPIDGIVTPDVIIVLNDLITLEDKEVLSGILTVCRGRKHLHGSVQGKTMSNSTRKWFAKIGSRKCD